MKLHLVNDEKIINRTIDEFEAVWPGQNLWVVANRRKQFRLVEPRACVIGRDEFLSRYSGAHFPEVYVHLLNPRKIKLLKRLDLRGSRVSWIIWGLDLYNKLLVPRGFRMFMPGNSGAPSGVSAFFKKMGAWLEARRTVRFIERHVDAIVTDTTEVDYDYLVRYYPDLAAKPWKDFFYYPIDAILNPALMASEVSGDNIMIGNSASATNNHEYAFELLAGLDTRGRRIVVPLSYSGKGDYVERVSARGRKLFGDSFEPLLQFMPLAEYNRLQAATSVAIFANLRQEAVGNIIIALYLGARVFLHPDNPVYRWAADHGLAVFDLTTLTQQDLDTPLDAATRESNRRILTSLYTRQRLHRLIAALPEAT